LDQGASDKAVRVDADAAAPAFGMVSDVDLTHRDSGVLTYKVDDKLHVVVESENPTVFGLIEAAGQSAVNGDRIATDNEKWPPALDTQVEAPGTLGAGVIRYEHDGKNVVVESHVNPALFDYLTTVHTLGQSPEGLSALDKLVDDGATLADRNTAAPALADIDAVSKVTDGVYRVELKDGKSIAVSRELTPDLYTDIGNLSQVKDGLAASEKDGYAMADSELDPDTITV
ncbi:hypothetical protein, partial [Agrobacterium tumefaciens]|uniref:hypothetical protein n=1 Tax=Agrobacterium tumefaciens TaxID=358 RepID=UPI003BA23B44